MTELDQIQDAIGPLHDPNPCCGAAELAGCGTTLARPAASTKLDGAAAARRDAALPGLPERIAWIHAHDVEARTTH